MDDRELQDILESVQRRTGITFRIDQHKAVAATIHRLMNQYKLPTANAFLDAIEKDLTVYNALVDEITIGETYFFREPKQFEFIKTQLIPEFRQRRGEDATLRAWSAACASGEEAYSLAIVCHQMSQQVTVLATDISPKAIAKARHAKYRDWSFRGGAMTQLKSYISGKEDDIQLDDFVGKSVRFRVLNLASTSYPDERTGLANLDLILCRNVLIYFDRTTVDEISERLFRCLAPGGWLITASGDPSLRVGAGFSTVMTDHGTFYQRPLVSAPGGERPRAGVVHDQRNEGNQNRITSPSKPVDLSPSTAQPMHPSAASPSSKSSPPAKVSASSKLSPSDAAASKAAAASPSVATARAGRTDGDSQYKPTPHWLSSAHVALESRDSELAIRLTEEMMHNAEACAINVRARARKNADEALETCASTVVRHPLSNELHFLHAELLVKAGKLDEAFQAAQKALFLDRSVAMAHFLFGSIQLQRGQSESAYRHFLNVRELCSQQASHFRLPLSRNETAASVAAAAESQMKKIRSSD
ncbi:MAG: hypothetical protein HKN47_00355 [Pirellulaceae bacterium]|nr:hypothetical protein [Pirellulaceae bacterium]